MDSVVKPNFSKTLPISLMPVRICDMDDVSGPQKAKPVTPIPLKFMPIRTSDLAKQLGMGSESAKKSKNVCKKLWSDKKKRKSSVGRLSTSMKPQKKDVRKTTYGKPFLKDLHEESFTLINMENFKQTPHVFGKSNKKSILKTINEHPKSEIPKIKDDQSSSIFKKPSQNADSTKTKYFEPVKPTRLNMLPGKINKNESLNTKNCSNADKKESTIGKINKNESLNTTDCSNANKNESIVNSLSLILNNKLEEFYNKINSRLNEHDSKFDIIMKKIDKLEINKCKNCKTKDLKITASAKKQNKFELLESKFNNGSPLSAELSLSDIDPSPTIVKDITWLINDKEDSQEPKLYKSLSASSVVVENSKKSVTFHSKSQNDLDSVDKYNEIRNNATFLCTPKNTRTAANLMTPSVKNSQKKMISRKVQEQLLMLD